MEPRNLAAAFRFYCGREMSEEGVAHTAEFDTYVTFQHTVIASANSGDLVCDAPSSANTLVGRYFGSDFIEYQKSDANGAGNYVNLRTNLVKLA